ncbi:MAG TPA: response regulator [Pseudolabrys sp.]|nr:response regulator [Pseudolabrys sp.]
MTISDSLLTGRRCLVLDDEFLIALDIQQILELAGAKHVASVATASETIALLRREPKFDLAVLDLKLGGSEDNSLGVASELARMGTPFVFLTGMHVDNVHVRKFPQAPVAEKPYDALALLDAVQRALKHATP